jgi:hypothetical protein
MPRLRMIMPIAILAGPLSLAGNYSPMLLPATGQVQVTQVPCGKALSSLHPAAGTTIALKRGCSYSGTLAITADNVIVTDYGTGSNPVLTLISDGATVDLAGSGDTIENLSLVGAPTSTWNCRGKKTPAGHVDGIDIESGALNNTVTNVSATGFYAAVYIMAGSTGNIVENSTFTNNTELDTNNAQGSSGAFGVLIWGNFNTIAYNTITGNQACSIAYGYDGSAVEIFGGSHNLIDGNTATNDNGFTELGSHQGSIATANTFQANSVADGAGGLGTTFLVTRGSLDADGPVYNTIVTDNTVNLTKSGDDGAVSYAWAPGDGTLLTLTGNYLNLGRNQALYEDGGYVDGGGNTFIGTCNPASDC